MTEPISEADEPIRPLYIERVKPLTEESLNVTSLSALPEGHQLSTTKLPIGTADQIDDWFTKAIEEVDECIALASASTEGYQKLLEAGASPILAVSSTIALPAGMTAVSSPLIESEEASEMAGAVGGNIAFSNLILSQAKELGDIAVLIMQDRILSNTEKALSKLEKQVHKVDDKAIQADLKKKVAEKKAELKKLRDPWKKKSLMTGLGFVAGSIKKSAFVMSAAGKKLSETAWGGITAPASILGFGFSAYTSYKAQKTVSEHSALIKSLVKLNAGAVQHKKDEYEKEVMSHVEEFAPILTELTEASTENFEVSLKEAGFSLEELNERLNSRKEEPVNSPEELKNSPTAQNILLGMYAGKKRALNLSVRNGLKALSLQKQTASHKFLTFVRTKAFLGTLLAIGGVAITTVLILSGSGVIIIPALTLTYLKLGVMGSGALVSLGSLCYLYRNKPNLSKAIYSWNNVKSKWHELKLAIGKHSKAKAAWELNKLKMKSAQIARLETALKQEDDALLKLEGVTKEEAEKIISSDNKKRWTWLNRPAAKEARSQREKELDEKIQLLKAKLSDLEEKVKPYQDTKLDAKWHDYILQVGRQGIGVAKEFQEAAPAILAEGAAALIAGGHMEEGTQEVLKAQFGIEELPTSDESESGLAEALRKFFIADEQAIPSKLGRLLSDVTMLGEDEPLGEM